ncbi:MAG: selenocysteine-specific translation elongation factor [Spirochaetaceae bacterium]|jgi:selenocysteine-specific elongation factor|nr:selenocysteine-specific translation elongation factor [Spirochaetaceae bacterium]
MEYPFIFGTAGHIDHGKTALVQAMTGVDCDRLEAEKRRGITIELGFAPLTLGSGKTVSIIDVPGHERFIRQMAAGATGMDAAILVIAASEGVMPQTREHLDILRLLGIKRGVVTLTKQDLVDGETLELAREEASELIRGSCLEGAPILPVSSRTGVGISRLLEELERILSTLAPRSGSGTFFLPIDRVFSQKGFGAVVTGTSYQGRLSVGDEVAIMPAGMSAKVRSLQTHGAAVQRVRSGQRVAVNLTSVPLELLQRGAVVCAPGAFIATSCMDAWLEVLPSAPRGVSHWQRVRLHTGTADLIARVSLLNLEGDKKKAIVPPGSGAPVQLITESPLVVMAGQRFVIRFYSPLTTIGGGRMLLPNAETAKGLVERREKARLLTSLTDHFGPVSLLRALIQDRGLLAVSDLKALSQMDPGTFEESLVAMAAESAQSRDSEDSDELLSFGPSPYFISLPAFRRARRRVLRFLEDFHARYPERSGLDAEKLLAALTTLLGAHKMSGANGKALLGLMAGEGITAIAVQGKTVYRLSEHREQGDKKLMDLAARIQVESEGAGFNLLKLSDLEDRFKTGVSPAYMKRALAYLREHEGLRIIDGGLVFPRKTQKELLTLLRSMTGDITVASLRDALGVNRKSSLAMLDFLDAQGLTQRVGDTRHLPFTSEKAEKAQAGKPHNQG